MEKDPSFLPFWQWIFGIAWTALSAVVGYVHLVKVSKREFDAEKENTRAALKDLKQVNTDQHGAIGREVGTHMKYIRGGIAEIKTMTEKRQTDHDEKVETIHKRIDALWEAQNKRRESGE